MVFINICILLLLLAFLYFLQKRYISFNKRSFIALFLGVLLGVYLKIFNSSEQIFTTLYYYQLVGTGYIFLLKMIVYPIIMVAVLTTFTKVEDGKLFTKAGSLILIILLITTTVGALIGVFSAYLFNLNITNFVVDPNFDLHKRLDHKDTSIIGTILNFIPTNPFLDFTGSRPTSTISVVIFMMLIGVSYLGVKKKHPEQAEIFKSLVLALYEIVIRLVTLILRLTPYGITALLAHTIAISNTEQILGLGRFLSAGYFAMFLMLGVHIILLLLTKTNVLNYFKKVVPLLAFAFSARSSLASIPLNIETQTKKLGIPHFLATISSSLSSMMAQNACSGIYPAILVYIGALSVGINPLEPQFLFYALFVILVSSFGVAGVGGGAIFATLIVLPTLGLPVGIIAIFIAVDPIIDMGRTAVNVNAGVVASLTTAKFLDSHDKTILESNDNEKSDFTHL